MVFLGKNAVSIRDVAKRSGVSIATVSNVLNNRCNVSEELRQRVYQAVEELDYVANPIARSMRSSRTLTVGVMVVDLNCIFFAPLLKGIQNVLSKAGYSVIIYDSNYDGATERKYVQMMRNNLVDGLIIAGMSDTQNKAFYTKLTQEDPRIFENGYTGANGRMDRRASGIGLSLCRRICKNLGHVITAESELDRGTIIRINLDQRRLEVE